MKSPFDILGIPTPPPGKIPQSTIDLAKKAYRKLSMEHHPDRGGNEEKFKEIKQAWEQIESGKVAKEPFSGNHQTDINEILRKMREQRGAGFSQFVAPLEYVVNVNLQDAYNGFSLNVTSGSKSGVIPIPGKLPNGHRGKYKLADGTDVLVIVDIIATKFTFVSNKADNKLDNGDLIFKTGELETTIEVDALDIILGAWINTTDFLGQTFSIRIPSGFDIKRKLKVAEKGYYDWNETQQKSTEQRGNLFVKIIPIFSKPTELNKEKVNQLHDLVNANPAKS